MQAFFEITWDTFPQVHATRPLSMLNLKKGHRLPVSGGSGHKMFWQIIEFEKEACFVSRGSYDLYYYSHDNSDFMMKLSLIVDLLFRHTIYPCSS